MEIRDFLNQEKIKNEIKRRISYNPITGELLWKQRGSKFFDDNYAGKSCLQTWVCKDGYKMSITKPTLFGRTVSIMGGRLAWFLYYDDWPKYTIDHINKNSLDHRIDNLRDVTQKENNSNKGAYKCSTTGFRGVSKMAGKYWARISLDGVTYRLGYHDTPEEAARAYDKKAKDLLGDRATLNFPDEGSS